MKLVIPLHSLYWSIDTKDESKRGTAFAFIFGVNWHWSCGVTASFGCFFFHEIKRNGMTSFMEFMSPSRLQSLPVVPCWRNQLLSFAAPSSVLLWNHKLQHVSALGALYWGHLSLFIGRLHGPFGGFLPTLSLCVINSNGEVFICLSDPHSGHTRVNPIFDWLTRLWGTCQTCVSPLNIPGLSPSAAFPIAILHHHQPLPHN